MIKRNDKHSNQISGTISTENSLFVVFQLLQHSRFCIKRKEKVSEQKCFGFLELYLVLLSISYLLTHCWREWLSEGWEKMTIHTYSTGKKGPIFLQHIPWIKAWKNDWPWSIPFPCWNGYFFQYIAKVNGTMMFPLIFIMSGQGVQTYFHHGLKSNHIR